MGQFLRTFVVDSSQNNTLSTNTMKTLIKSLKVLGASLLLVPCVPVIASGLTSPANLAVCGGLLVCFIGLVYIVLTPKD